MANSGHFAAKSVQKCDRTSHPPKRSAHTHIAHTLAAKRHWKKSKFDGESPLILKYNKVYFVSPLIAKPSKECLADTPTDWLMPLWLTLLCSGWLIMWYQPDTEVSAKSIIIGRISQSSAIWKGDTFSCPNDKYIHNRIIKQCKEVEIELWNPTCVCTLSVCLSWWLFG